MQSLLRWGIENSTSDGPHQPPQPQVLDTGIIDHILGKPDAVLMKEALSVAQDDSREEDERISALDDLEMLIENIDNANDLEKLKMWKPLQDILTSPSSSDAIKMQTLWVVGTAVQNNPSAQNAYLSISPIPDLLAVLSSSPISCKTRSKAVYALSGLLKHNSAAVEAFGAADGWACLRLALEDPDITVRRKIVFLINTLLIRTSLDDSRVSTNLHTPSTQSGPVYANSHASMVSDPSSTETSPATLKALRQQGLLAALISALTAPFPHGLDGEGGRDSELEESILRLLQTYTSACDGKFSLEEKAKLARFLDEEAKKADDGGINSEEIKWLKLAIL